MRLTLCVWHYLNAIELKGGRRWKGRWRERTRIEQCRCRESIVKAVVDFSEWYYALARKHIYTFCDDGIAVEMANGDMNTCGLYNFPSCSNQPTNREREAIHTHTHKIEKKEFVWLLFIRNLSDSAIPFVSFYTAFKYRFLSYRVIAHRNDSKHHITLYVFSFGWKLYFDFVVFRYCLLLLLVSVYFWLHLSSTYSIACRLNQ